MSKTLQSTLVMVALCSLSGRVASIRILGKQLNGDVDEVETCRLD